MKSVDTIAVIGAGTMGHGIAEVAALAGYGVNLRDVNQELIEKGLDLIKGSLNKLVAKELIKEEKAKQAINHIFTTVDLKEALEEVDFVIEAIPEKLDLKKELFKDLDRFTTPYTILATNTSSLSITEIASFTQRPQQVVGLHFFNPVVKMKLVEVIRAPKTSDQTVKTAVKLSEKMGKVPVICKKDIRGFIVNSILIPYLNEACRLVERREATIKQIDSAMKYKEKLPMGPFELMDLIGVDVVTHTGESIGEEVPSLLKEKLEDGKLGRKSGQGFYNYQRGGVDYTKQDSEEVGTLHLFSIMVNQAAKVIEKSAASFEDIETAMKLGTGMPKGPLTKAKEAGTKQVVDKLKELSEEYSKERYTPSSWLKKQAQSGG